MIFLWAIPICIIIPLASAVTLSDDSGVSSTYTVIFNLNYNGASNNIPPQNVVSGEYAPIPAEPIRQGYKFIGWYTAADCLKMFIFDENINANKTLYAGWAVQPPAVEVIKLTYGYSGKGRPLTCVTLKPLNNQNKAVFLNFAIHGAEDAWIGDSWLLVKIADDLEKYYTENPEHLNGTTLTIVRLANPDGLNEGWTNNGPGRCTVVGGYDLNRIWPTGFRVCRSARNYTGNAPLLASEAIALRDLVIAKANENGGKLNFLYDFHGWLNTSFGSNNACWQFQQTLGIGYSGHLGGGYFANWAKAYANSTALIEYAWPSEQQQAHFSIKTIDALKMIL